VVGNQARILIELIAVIDFHRHCHRTVERAAAHLELRAVGHFLDQGVPKGETATTHGRLRQDEFGVAQAIEPLLDHLGQRAGHVFQHGKRDLLGVGR